MNAAETARKAAEIASERGHCKNMEEDAQGHVCFIGAVKLAYCGKTARDRVFFSSAHPVFNIVEAAARVLARRDGIAVTAGIYMFTHNPVRWNNLENTSGEDVVLLLKEAAEELDTW